MEAKQVAELERLLEEYRGLVSASGTPSSANGDTIAKLTEEKEQLTKKVAELNQYTNTLKIQLEVLESKVKRKFSNYSLLVVLFKIFLFPLLHCRV